MISKYISCHLCHLSKKNRKENCPRNRSFYLQPILKIYLKSPAFFMPIPRADDVDCLPQKLFAFFKYIWNFPLLTWKVFSVNYLHLHAYFEISRLFLQMWQKLNFLVNYLHVACQSRGQKTPNACPGDPHRDHDHSRDDLHGNHAFGWKQCLRLGEPEVGPRGSDPRGPRGPLDFHWCKQRNFSHKWQIARVL